MKVNTDGVLLGAAMTIPPGAKHLLDIGTGTGTVALMAAQRCSNAIIDAIDIDAPSAQEAAGNFASSPWSLRLRAFHTPLSEFRTSSRYDLIFSNPPYFDSSLLNPDARESEARHSVSLSYRDVLDFAAENLNPEGGVSIILPSDTEKMLLRHAGSRGLFPYHILKIRTTPRKKPSRIIAEFGFAHVSPVEEMLTIQENGRHTDEYVSLTEKFYLSL